MNIARRCRTAYDPVDQGDSIIDKRLSPPKTNSVVVAVVVAPLLLVIVEKYLCGYVVVAPRAHLPHAVAEPVICVG